MPRTPPRRLAAVRHTLLVLLALALLTRMGLGCEPASAAPSPATAHTSHCPDKPLNAEATTCALCAALPDAPPATASLIVADVAGPIAPNHPGLTARTGGPAPPPPRYP